jgi:hypothetical protein
LIQEWSWGHIGEVSVSGGAAVLWRRCQQQGILLLTGNRNAEKPEALEAVIALENTPTSLPVLTLSTPAQVFQSRAYADRVVTRLLEILLALEQYRGTGRLYPS